jgi:excinuclease ABC subunit B
MTDSMKKAIYETDRRRKIQTEYNTQHGITPKTIVKAIPTPITSLDNDGNVIRLHDRSQLAKRALRTGAGSGHGKSVWSAADSATAASYDLLDPSSRVDEIQLLAGEWFTSVTELPKIVMTMEGEMKTAARGMQFERAAELRDRIKRLKVLQLGM